MSGSGQGNDLASTAGANIRRERDRLELTQRELAGLVGGKTTGQRISDWERGVDRPSDASLLRLGEIFGRPFAWFFVDHDEQVAA